MKDPARIGLAILVAISSQAQDLSDILPELKVLPAPPVITEGLRLSYYSAVATVSLTDYDQWRRDGENSLPETNPSGHGFTQVEVVALDAGVAVLNLQAWQYHLFDGPLVPIPGGQRGQLSAAGGGDWWVHPVALARLEDTAVEGLSITRMPYTVSGQTYAAVRIQKVSEKGGRVVVYDLESGLLIYQGTMVGGGETVSYSQASLRDRRQVTWPWQGRPLGPEAARLERLAYDGTVTAFPFGGMPLRLAATAEVEVTGRGANWLAYTQTVTLEGYPGMPPTVETTFLATGTGHASGLWLPPEVLGGLAVGQVLDVDPVTGARVTVRTRETAANGSLSITFRVDAGSATQAETTFDAMSGLALRLWSRDAASALYATENEFTLRDRRLLPAAPRLGIRWDRAQGRWTIDCPTEAGRVLTLRESADGGRTWSAVPGFDRRPCDGTSAQLVVQNQGLSKIFSGVVE